MLLNSLRRGKDIIMQSTEDEDRTFHQVNNIINKRKAPRLTKITKIPKPDFVSNFFVSSLKFPNEEL